MYYVIYSAEQLFTCNIFGLTTSKTALTYSIWFVIFKYYFYILLILLNILILLNNTIILYFFFTQDTSNLK